MQKLPQPTTRTRLPRSALPLLVRDGVGEVLGAFKRRYDVLGVLARGDDEPAFVVGGVLGAHLPEPYDAGGVRSQAALAGV